MNKIKILVVLMGLFLFNQSFSQVLTPKPSPFSTIQQEVGLTDVTIKYSRPSVKDREVFGDLVPYGTMWRTGANASTKITFSDDVWIKGNKLDAGTYALYTIPNEDEWIVIFHTATEYSGTGGTNYKKEDDALRVTVDPQDLNDHVETMAFDIQNIRNSTADIVLKWDDQMIAIPLRVDTERQVLENIDRVMSGPSGRDYYSAASFYLEEGKDPEQALEWINISIQKDGPRFWNLHRKALILAELGRHKEAVEVANKSKKLAMEEDVQQYVKMNNELISKCSAMTK